MLTSIVADIPALIAAYGYGLILAMVMLESLGLPLPGETTLITASIYAGATHDLTLTGIIMAAVVGAVTGDNIGFWIGEKVGTRLLIRLDRPCTSRPPRSSWASTCSCAMAARSCSLAALSPSSGRLPPFWPEPTRCPGLGFSPSTSRVGSSGPHSTPALPTGLAHGFTPWQVQSGSPLFCLQRPSWHGCSSSCDGMRLASNKRRSAPSLARPHSIETQVR